MNSSYPAIEQLVLKPAVGSEARPVPRGRTALFSPGVAVTRNAAVALFTLAQELSRGTQARPFDAGASLMLTWALRSCAASGVAWRRDGGTSAAMLEVRANRTVVPRNTSARARTEASRRAGWLGAKRPKAHQQTGVQGRPSVGLCEGFPDRNSLRPGKNETTDQAERRAAGRASSLKNRAWLTMAFTVSTRNGFEMRKAGSGRWPVSKVSG